LPPFASAQISFDKTEFNFATLENWNQHPAEFHFTNTSNENIAILRVDAAEEVHARYPANFILPGQTSRILIYYEPMVVGNFQEEIYVYTIISNKPIKLRIKGKVKSIIECPSNDNNSYAIPSFKQAGQVLDKRNGKPVPAANIKLIDAQKTVTRLRTDSRGNFVKQLDRGIYTLIIDAPGYNIYAEEIYLDKNSAPLVFMLEKPDSGPVTEKPEAKAPEKKENVTPPVLLKAFEGTVINSKTKQPVNQAAVNLQNIDSRINYFYLTWQDGKFRKQLKPGTYLLNIVAKNYETYEDTLKIENTSRPVSIGINPMVVKPDTLNKALSNRNPLYIKVEGIVTDKAGGQPVANASIRFIDRYNVPSLYSTYKNGKFKKELLKGPYTVVIKAKNYQSFARKLYLNNDSSNIVFELERPLQPILPDSGTEKHPVDSALIALTEKPGIILNKEPPFDTIKMDEQPERTSQQEQANNPVKTIAELDRSIYNANNIVFLIDVSGSMKEFSKIDLLKVSMKKLVTILRDIDNVTIITYATKQNLILSGVKGNEKDQLNIAIDSLKPHGFTYGMEGLQKAYDQSRLNRVSNGNNQVILVTDGMFNSPDYTEKQLISLVKKMKTEGISISVIGFGREEEGIKTMKKIAKYGGGNYLLIENKETSESVITNEIMNNSKKELK
jgi:Mg-chelatase subunit ChlD